MEIFDWWEAPTHGRVEWKSTSLEHGVLLLTQTGTVMMQLWCVGIWATSNQVISYKNVESQ